MSWLADLLKEYPALSVVKERLAFVDERLKKTESEKVELEKEIAALNAKLVELEGKNADLRGQVVKLTMRTNFIEREGVLWKREDTGEVNPIAYCPKCELPMHKVKHGVIADEVICSQCRFKAPFKTYRVEQIAADLNLK